MFFLAENFPNFYVSMAIAGLLLYLMMKNPSREFSWSYFALAGLMLLSMRLPVILFNNQLNVDESQMVANLRLFRIEPIYWQSIDGGTIGPMAYYVALVATSCFENIDFVSIRWLGFACLIFSLILFYRIVVKTTGAFAANLAVFLLLCFFTFLTHPDFLHYSSEQLPVLFLTLAVYVQIKEWKKDTPKRINHFLLGFLVGLIPYVKIQAVPICGIIALFELLHLYRQKSDEGWKALGIFIGGAISFSIIFILMASYLSVLDDFWIYYIEDNIIYTGTNKSPYGIVKLIKLLGKSFDYFALLTAAGTVVIVAFLANFRGLMRFQFAYFSLLFLSGLFAAAITRNNFPHYLYLTIFPIGFLFAFAFQILPEKYEKFRFLSVALLLGWFLINDIATHQISNHLVRMKHDKNLAMSPVGIYLHQISKVGDRMSVWGWQGKLYSEAGILQASAENHTLHCMQPSVLKKNHIQRYLADLERNKARIIVDASPDDPNFLDRLEKIPEVNAYVKSNYTLDTTIANNRIFIRKD